MANHHVHNRLTRFSWAVPICMLTGALFLFPGDEGVSADAAHAGPQYVRPGDPSAPFSAAVRVENILYLSGQIGTGADGRLPAGFGDQVRQTMANIGATLKASGSSFDDVFKCTVMLADMSRWEEFNKIYVTYFKPERLPARSAFGATGLARGALLELECAAYSPRH